MRISVIGTGYVGIVNAACLAELGYEVICVDINEEIITKINAGISPVYEEGLAELLEKHAGKNMCATTDYRTAIINSDVSFICVGTPQNVHGSIDLSSIEAASSAIGEALLSKKEYHVIAVKSTVVPETTENVILPIIKERSGKHPGEFGIAVNPEFLREGKGVYDFMHPERIVIGSIDRRSGDLVASLYRNINCEVIRTNPRTAEMIKYVNNA